VSWIRVHEIFANLDKIYEELRGKSTLKGRKERISRRIALTAFADHIQGLISKNDLLLRELAEDFNGKKVQS